MSTNLIPTSGNLSQRQVIGDQKSGIPAIIPVNKSPSLDEQQEVDLSNNEFLNAIFGSSAGDQHPMYCSFIGHPGKVSSEKWAAMPWLTGKMIFTSRSNNYFSMASFNPCSERKYRRQKRYFAAQHAVLLDDVGTKAVSLDRLTLPPSWLLETSPGNFQAGYIFREPIVDGAIAERLMKSIIAAGLCDPGADGPLTRLARLPVGSNGKHDPPFKCRLAEWHPDRRYSIEELAEGLQLDFSLIPERHIALETGNNTGATGIGDQLYIPRCKENPVVTRLKLYDLYIRPLGDCKHEIICPWQREHTDALGGGSVYFEPSESFPVGGYSCLHGHCRNRHIKDLCEFLEVSRSEAKNRSTIRIPGGNLSEIVDHCEVELARSGGFYNSGGLITNVVPDRGKKEVMFMTLSLHSIVRYLSNLVCFERFDKRSREWISCDPPERYCRILYDAQNYPHLPVLNGVVRQPYLRPDGSLVTESGYDEVTGLMGAFDKHRFSVPDEPSRQDAEHALGVLISLLEEFSFKTESDLSAALSAILTAVIRPSLPLAPMYHVTAPIISSGKSTLTTLIACFATELPASAASFPAHDEECRKLLLAFFLAVPPVVCFDNLTSDLLPHKSLCSALTEEYLVGRILGVSKIATVSTRTLIVSSGNNVYPINDMTRRTIVIHLDPVCEKPSERVFKNNPVEMVRSDRGHFVSLALTIIRWWIVSNRPMIDVPNVATFTDWSALCRQPLLNLGRPDPAKSVFVSIKQDPDRESLGRMLHNWYLCFESRPTMIRDASKMANASMMESFMDIAGDRGSLSNKRLGRWIARHANRIVDGLKFEKDTATRCAEAWRVISVKP